MSGGASKNKKMIVITICLAVVVIGLIIAVVIINNKDPKEPDPGSNEALPTESVFPTEEVTIAPVGGETDGKNDAEKDDEYKNDLDKAQITPALSLEELVKPGEYKGIKIEYNPVIVDDDRIRKALDDLKEKYTELIKLPDRPFEKGDMAIVTFQGEIDGYKPDELYGVCLQDDIGSGLLPEVIEEAIIGHRIGDVFVQPVDFPETFTLVPEAAGKTVNFTIELVDGFAYKIPVINDSFISEISDCTTLEEYKIKTKETLQEEENVKAHDAAMLSLKQQIISGFEYHEAVENDIKLEYVSKFTEENQYILENYMIDADTFYQVEYGMTQEEYQKMIMDEVEIKVKYEYALDRIALDEDFTVSQEEFDAAFNELYIESGAYPDKEAVYSARTEENIKKTVNEHALRMKTEKFIISNAIINNGEISEF